MKTSYRWLQTYFSDPLPPIEEVGDAFTFHSFEIEEIVGDMIDVKVLPNRAADCLSHRGVARELAAILNRKMKSDPIREPLPKFPETKSLVVSVNDPKCLRYMGAIVRNVTVGPSPEWLKNALESVGQRSINNVVDATNFVMLNIGQPLHAFDAALLGKSNDAYAISVRASDSGEKITALGGTEYALPEGTLLITDATNRTPLGIAGVKGGMAAEIREHTKDIVIESANFDGPSIRKTAQALKLWTDASLRYQNRPSPELCAYGMRDVVALIQEIAGGELEGVVDVYTRPQKPYKVGVSSAEVSALLGAQYSEDDVYEALTRLDLPFEKVSDPIAQMLTLAVSCEGKPYKLGASVRNDAPESFDCSSFISWLCAQSGIASPRVSVDQFLWGEVIQKDDLLPGDLVFANTGEGHIWFESKEYLAHTPVPEGVDHVGMYIGEGAIVHAAGSPHHAVIIEDLETSSRFKNSVGYRRIPASSEARFVVTVPFERNDLKIREDLIEEVGRIIGYERIQPATLPPMPEVHFSDKRRRIEALRSLIIENGFNEISTYAMTDIGDVELALPLAEDKKYLRVNLAHEHAKAVALNMPNLPLFGASDLRMFEVGHVWPNGVEKFVVGITYVVLGKGADLKRDAMFAELKRQVKELLGRDIPEGVVIGNTIEFDMHELVEEGAVPDVPPETPTLGMFRPFSMYPFVLRDIALWVPEGTSASDVSSVIVSHAGELLVRIDSFDTFTKEGRTSHAFHLVFQSTARTLSDEDVHVPMTIVTQALTEKGWQVR